MFVLVIFVAIFGYAGCSGRVEHNTVNVHVEHEKNTMVVVTGSTCFIVKLTTEELHQAINDFGREKLIVTIFRDVIGQAQEHKVYHNDRGLTNDMHKWCGDRDLYFLMRDAITSTAAYTHTPDQTFTSTTSGPASSTADKPSSPITSTFKGSFSPTISTLRRSFSPTISTTDMVPIIMYDKTLSMKAVIVTSSGCFVYRLSEIDKSLLNHGAVGKDMFEKALLSMDRSVTGLFELTGSLGYMKMEIQNACPDKVYLMS